MRFGRRKTREVRTAKGRAPATFRGFAESDPDLYEFRTIEGRYVYLHEMDCVDIQFNPVNRRLNLTFECLDSELMQHPLALTLSFEDAQIIQWLDDGSEPATAIASDREGRVRAQVSGLGQVEDAKFVLTLLDVTLNFVASSVECFVQPELTQSTDG